VTYFAGENFSPAAPTLYHKEQLGQDASALTREQIVPAIGTVVKDRLIAQRFRKAEWINSFSKWPGMASFQKW
jgi:hypothetical protein